MAKLWRKLLDGLVLVSGVAFSLVCVSHICAMWSIRREFVMAVRSPRLACVSGLFAASMVCVSFFRTLLMYSTSGGGATDLLTTLSIATLYQGSYVMRGIRLLIMYDPAKRRRFGRLFKENVILYALLSPTVVSILAGFLAAAAYGMERVVDAVLRCILPVQSAAFVSAAIALFPKLKKVDDMFDMSNELLLVGGWTLFATVLYVVALVVEATIHHNSAAQFFYILTAAASFMAPAYLTNIKPVRDWSRSRAPGNSVSIICPLVHGKIVTSAKFVMCKPSAVAIDDRVSVRSILARGPNASSVTSHGHGGTIELADVMSFLPLLEAFQEFCRRALCTESLHFLIAVSKFKEVVSASRAEGTAGKDSQYEQFITVVDEYIRRTSPSEVNIDSKTTADILKHARRDAFAELGPEAQLNVFAPAAKEIAKMLTDNVWNNFKVSDQYHQIAEQFLSLD